MRNDLNSLYFHSGHQKVILYPIICIDCLWNCNALYHKPGCAVINICTILLVCFLFFLIKFHFLENESYFVVFIRGGKMTINSKYLQPHNGHFLLWIVKKKGQNMWNITLFKRKSYWNHLQCDHQLLWLLPGPILKYFITSLIVPFKSQKDTYPRTYSA